MISVNMEINERTGILFDLINVEILIISNNTTVWPAVATDFIHQ